LRLAKGHGYRRVDERDVGLMSRHPARKGASVGWFNVGRGYRSTGIAPKIKPAYRDKVSRWEAEAMLRDFVGSWVPVWLG
jgi:hypothetical protein